MDAAVTPVQNGRGRRRRWNAEQKLTVLQEWQVPGWMEHYNREPPHSALGMKLPAECCDVVSQKQDTTCPHRRGSTVGFREALGISIRPILPFHRSTRP